MTEKFFNSPLDNLIAYRIIYYYPEKVRESLHKYLEIPDGDYDQLEREFLKDKPDHYLNEWLEVDFKHPDTKRVFKAIKA